jgi:hypothetical protein
MESSRADRPAADSRRKYRSFPHFSSLLCSTLTFAPLPCLKDEGRYVGLVCLAAESQLVCYPGSSSTSSFSSAAIVRSAKLKTLFFHASLLLVPLSLSSLVECSFDANRVHRCTQQETPPLSFLPPLPLAALATCQAQTPSPPSPIKLSPASICLLSPGSLQRAQPISLLPAPTAPPTAPAHAIPLKLRHLTFDS